MSPSDRHGRLGVWFVGARGAIAVAAMVGKVVLERDPGASAGMLTALPPFRDLDFTPWDAVFLGGCDVTETPLAEVAESHFEHQIIPRGRNEATSAALRTLDRQVRNFAARENGEPAGDLAALDRLALVREALAGFRREHGLDRIIVVNTASTEPVSAEAERLAGIATWDALREHLGQTAGVVPWGVVYAAAALLERCAYINFTPNLGVELPALSLLALEQDLPHAGKDGKTGQTLLKSVLGPMFALRDLEVMAWQSYNMLGNNDGKSLIVPEARAAKIESKNRQLASILRNSPDLHTHVAIDFVPSLGDWKTAFDFVHFKGFLGTKMTFQCTWTGSDTALAAPLLLDLVRFVDLAWRGSERGHLAHLDGYFKSPTGGDEHDFAQQMLRLFRHFGFDRSSLGRASPG